MEQTGMPAAEAVGTPAAPEVDSWPLFWAAGRRWPAAVEAPSAAGCLWADGWLANRAELCSALRLRQTASLRQVITAASRRWGESFPRRVLGSVSAIVWLPAERCLLLVADRVGHSSITFTHCDGSLWVAPEPARLVPFLPRRPPLDELSVVCHVGGETPPSGSTFFRGVSQVPPGHAISLRPDRQRREVYWQVDALPVLPVRSGDERAEMLRSLLGRVAAGYTAHRLGVTMTSGLDSNTVAAVGRHHHPNVGMVAFAWTAPELPEADESPIARRVADHLGVPLVPVRADTAWPLSGDEGALTGSCDPFRGYYHELWERTFAAVRQVGLNVLLTGAGGDLLFGGLVYSYPDLLLRGRWVELARQLREHCRHSELGLGQILRRTVLWPSVVAYSPAWQQRLARPPEWLAPRFADLFRRTVAARHPPRALLPGRYLRQRALNDGATRRLLPHLASQARAWGIEVVHPLLDHRLIEFAARLPTEDTFAAGRWKEIVRRAMCDLLPREVLDRRTKIVPAAIGQRGLKDRGRDRVLDLMTDMRAAEWGYVDEARLRRHYEEYLDGRHSGALFWYTLTLEDWLRNHF